MQISNPVKEISSKIKSQASTTINSTSTFVAADTYPIAGFIDDGTFLILRKRTIANVGQNRVKVAFANDEESLPPYPVITNDLITFFLEPGGIYEETEVFHRSVIYASCEVGKTTIINVQYHIGA
jgi:hypothetical protein